MKDGITIESEKYGLIRDWKPYRLVRNADEANDRPYKFIICATKCLPDLMPTASVLAPFLESEHAHGKSVDLEDGPTVVLIQNGIGIEHPLATSYPSVPIISVVAWIGANLKEGGRVTHGLLEQLIMGASSFSCSFGSTVSSSLADGGLCRAHRPLHWRGRPDPGRPRVRRGCVSRPPSPPSDPPRAQRSPSPPVLAPADAFADPHGYRQQPDGPSRLEEGKRRLKVFADLVNGGGGTATVVPDIQAERYSKNLWSASLSLSLSLSLCSCRPRGSS